MLDCSLADSADTYILFLAFWTSCYFFFQEAFTIKVQCTVSEKLLLCLLSSPVHF